jgi:hypothetical protein
MDEAVDQTMARSTSEQGADKAANLRRAQQKERNQLQSDISKAQSEIAKLNAERAPIAKELRAVEAEVGPIKYIAKLIYGDNPDANLLEKAVTWVIIIIVLVFDPLAVVLLLASQYSFQWFRKQEEEKPKSINDIVPQPQELVVEEETPAGEPKPFISKANEFWPFPAAVVSKEPEPVKEDDFKFLAEYEDITPKQETEMTDDDEEEIIDQAAENEKTAMRLWKSENPEKNSVKHQRHLLEKGVIKKLPWEDYLKPHADFADEEAAIEAAKWAQEQLDKSSDRPGDYLSEAESKKKDNQMDGEGRESADNSNQGGIAGYQQNAEQSESTIWQRIKKGQS